MGRLASAGFQRVADREVDACLKAQIGAGIDIVGDGELRRDNFYSFVSEKIAGVRMMSLADMLDTVEDRVSFEAMLQTLDAPAFAIRNPTCVGRLQRRCPLAVNEFLYLRDRTNLPIKCTLPGPYLLTRAMWVTAHSLPHYPDKTAMAADIVALLREEIADLIQAGATIIQFDEPVLTEVVHAGDARRRTFMCATLATRDTPESELAYAQALFNTAVAGFTGNAQFGLHVCRGNWSRREEVLLSGDYQPLVPLFQSLDLTQLVLEFATPRAGELEVVGRALSHRQIGLGCVNPRTAEVETPDSIVRSTENALRHWPADRIFLNPDCGFACFADRPVNDAETAVQKLRTMVDAARKLRKRHE